MTRFFNLAVSLTVAALTIAPPRLTAQQTLPLRQSALDWSARDPAYQIVLDSTVDARWLGGGATVPR